MKIITNTFLFTLSVILLSCSNKTDNSPKISKQEFADDIGKYVIIGEDIYQNENFNVQIEFNYIKAHQKIPIIQREIVKA